MALTIADLPLLERPANEVLALDRGPDPDYAGYGWARVDRLWLATHDRRFPRRIDNALVLAIHAADLGEPLADDVVLEFELPGAMAVTVLLSTFLETWLPRLPQDASAIVLSMCNPHHATLRCPSTAVAPVHHADGDVFAWLDPDRGSGRKRGDRIRLVADSWRTLRSVSTELEVRRPNAAISDEDKLTYAGIYLLKKLDLKPKDGGLELPIVLPSELSVLDEALQQLAVDDMLVLNNRKNRWDLTKKGIDHLGKLIDEATDLIDEFDDDEMPEVVEELKRRRLDPFRARFLWGWYDGEFDDLVLFQEQRGLKPVERMWAFYLMGDDFWNELARDLEGD